MSLALVPDHIGRDLERAVLCAVLMEPEASLRACADVKLRHQDFTDRRNQLIYAAAWRILKSGSTVDPLTVCAFLEQAKCLAEVGGKDYIAGLIDEIPTAANVRAHALMVRNAQRGHTEVQHIAEQDAQVGEALDFLDLKAEDFLRYPWPLLDQALGGLSPRRPHWFAAHTGAGKTSLVETLKKHYMIAGKRVYSAGLELQPSELRTVVACRMLGVDHGELFKGNLQRGADWPTLRETLRREIQSQRTEAFYTEHLRLAPFDRLTADVAARICDRAAEWNADILFVDHVDHLDAEANGGRERAESLAVVKVLNALAKSHGLRAIFTSQTNREGKANNPLRDHYPISAEMVRHGDHKIMESAAFCGLRRPIKRDIDKGLLAEAHRDRSKIRDLLATHTMAVNVMKDRYGHASHEDIWLGFWRGEVLAEPGHANPDVWIKQQR